MLPLHASAFAIVLFKGSSEMQNPLSSTRFNVTLFTSRIRQAAVCASLVVITLASDSTAQDQYDGGTTSREIGQQLAGGGSFADFDSLMQLIETTVVPDTWESLGGPSTMAPYPQGVYVDPDGTLLTCVTAAQSVGLADLTSLLKQPVKIDNNLNTDWRLASPMRVVSLRRMRDEMLRHRLIGQGMPESVRHLSGLSRVKYIVLTDDDILIASPVGGIEQVDAWFRDRQSGLNTLRSDFLLTCLKAAVENQAFGCTIDPTPQGMKAAAEVAQNVQSKEIPVGKAAQEMGRALGMQRVEVFGTDGGTPLGYVMVEADRHMKQLALGQAEMPEGVKNYLDVVDDFITQGPPDQLLLRLWFTASARHVRADNDRRVFEIAGSPIKLSGENQQAMRDGQRGKVTVDERSDAFVKEFNDHWNDIRSKFPIYGALESIYRVASVAELAHRFAKDDAHLSLIDSLAAESSLADWDLIPPRQVASIAVHHRVNHGRKIHHVVVASGGVSVDSQQTVLGKITDYPSLKSTASIADSKPRLVQRWWWDVK
jgi:hypothetical protein